MLTSILFKDLQTQSSREDSEEKQIRDQSRRIEKLSTELQHQKADFEKKLSAVERVLAAKDGRHIVPASAS